MRKLFFAFTMLIFCQFSFGQGVTDNAVIPVSVTLNSILRLTVTSGGNIQFVVNTISQYTNGIPWTALYTTKFRVSSSRNFHVTLAAENTTGFTGLEAGTSNVFTNDNVGLTTVIPAASTATGTVAALAPLGAAASIVTGGLPGGNQDYEIRWELGTGAPLNAATLLDQNLPADVYIQNVFLTLVTP